MRLSILMAVVMLLWMPHGATAQEGAEFESVFSDYLNVQPPGGFLHIDGLDFSSSMGFSYMSGNGIASVGMGYYMGHFSLRLSPSLTMSWDVGIQSELTGQYAGQQPRLVLPNIDLAYRPSEKLFFRIQYRRYSYPSYYLLRR